MKGEEFERECSIYVHRTGVPLLICPHLLRKKGLGQIDIARYYRGEVQIFEAKQSLRISTKQKMRLKRAGLFISMVFKTNVVTRLLIKRPYSCQNFSDLLSS